MKNKPLLFVFILLAFWIFGKDDKPQTRSTAPLPVTGTVASSSYAAESNTVMTTPDTPQLKTHYVNADTLKVRDAPNGNAIASLTRGAQVSVYEQRASWSRISHAQSAERWVHNRYLCDSENCYVKSVASRNVQPQPAYRTEYQSAPARQAQPRNHPDADNCSCSSGRVCIGPRGGRYCITAGGNKRYGVGYSPSTSSCPCSSGNVCIGPRGGRYCITSGGKKKYGV